MSYCGVKVQTESPCRHCPSENPVHGGENGEDSTGWMVFSMFLFGALGHWGTTQFTRAQPPAARVDGTTTKNRSAKDRTKRCPLPGPMRTVLVHRGTVGDTRCNQDSI